jgi:subtilisin family serine protease
METLRRYARALQVGRSARRHRPGRAASTIAVALALLAGCGTDAEDAAPGSSTTAPPTTAATTTTQPPARPAPPSLPAPTPPPTTAAPAALGDPLLDQQWAIAQLRLPEVWSRGARGEGVVIAVVDTGVDLDHPDLVDRLVPGIDVVDGDPVPQDTNGHGTHVAGIAAATADNGVGIAGTAPLARIMPVRVLGTDGTGTDDGIARGIDWAVANGADVVNLSLGESGVLSRISKGGPLNAAIRNAAGRGVVVLAAAGNEGATKRNYRAGTPTLVVNATDEAGRLAQFSNSGDLRAVAAPGVGILSTAPNEPTTLWPGGSGGYERLDGTSMATPIVSGVAALLIASGVDPATIIDRITQTANSNGNPQLGAGVVDPVEATP